MVRCWRGSFFIRSPTQKESHYSFLHLCFRKFGAFIWDVEVCVCVCFPDLLETESSPLRTSPRVRGFGRPGNAAMTLPGSPVWDGRHWHEMIQTLQFTSVRPKTEALDSWTDRGHRPAMAGLHCTEPQTLRTSFGFAPHPVRSHLAEPPCLRHKRGHFWSHPVRVRPNGQ